MTAAVAALRRPFANVSRGALVATVLAVAALLYIGLRGQWTLPHDANAPIFDRLNELRDWVSANKAANPILVVLVGFVRVVVASTVDGTAALLGALGWLGVTAIATLVGFLANGRRLALFGLTGALSLGVLGFWEPAMDTLALTFASVVLSLLFGIPLGILAGRNDRVSRAISPILDVMQIMPTYAYLAPMVLFFSIGSASAAIATMIYAMPAAIRITALGIRSVPAGTVEASASLGATRRQILRHVQLPLSARALGLAVNQTLMLAVSMVVLTALIAAPGLGVDIVRAIETVNVGAAFDAGLAIVILAIVLDRLSEHVSKRLDPRGRATADRVVPRRVVLLALAAAAMATVIGRVLPIGESFPNDVVVSFEAPVNAAMDWARVNLFGITDAIKEGVTAAVLNPLETLLVTAPWWLVAAVVLAIATIVSGVRSAVIATVCLAGVAAVGLWTHGMETLAQVIVATIITLAIGLVLGIASARSDRGSALLRPFLDAAQTLPAFVYLIPAVAFFATSRFTAIVAAVIFAVPPVIRLVETGIRGVPPATVEASRSSGATSLQLLWKVQLPVAKPALLLAANQGIVMVLGMVVIGGLVGAGALGYDVVAGFAQRFLFGSGLAAGIALVLLGVALDRITQGAGRRREIAGARRA